MPTVVTLTGPGTGIVTDDAAVAITTVLTPVIQANYAAIIAQIGNAEVPGTMLACLAEINHNLGRIADQDKAIAKAIGDLNIAMGTMATASMANNSVQAMLAANTIQTNNFQTQVTKDALKRADIPEPEMPEFKEQIKTAVKEGIEFNAISRVNGAVTNFINTSIQDTATWIAGTAAYQTVSEYLKKAKDSILSIEISSGRSLASMLKTGKAPIN